ncbi:MAG: aquaporin, partial [Bryobacterales bacterium]|nr:aquaporin [Bryobacterales bacterium]
MSPTPLKLELLAEFLGTFVLILFGNGVVAQTVLFPDKGSFTNINIAWGLGVVF